MIRSAKNSLSYLVHSVSWTLMQAMKLAARAGSVKMNKCFNVFPNLGGLPWRIAVFTHVERGFRRTGITKSM